MTDINDSFNEEVFDGEILAAFDTDPFGLGHDATGAIASAVGGLRAAAKKAASAASEPAPTKYHVKVSVKAGKVEITFKAE